MRFACSACVVFSSGLKGGINTCSLFKSMFKKAMLPLASMPKLSSAN